WPARVVISLPCQIPSGAHSCVHGVLASWTVRRRPARLHACSRHPRRGGCSVRRLRAGVLVLFRVAAAHIAAVVERRIAVVGGHCAFAGGLGFLGVSIHGHIVVGCDLLEPLLGSLRTAFFLGLGTAADSGLVDLLLGVVPLTCSAVGQTLRLVAHGVPLFCPAVVCGLT